MKPVSLIVANTMHDYAPQLDHELIKKVFTDAPQKRGEFAAALARKLLCSISHEGADSVVYKALAAIGAPSSEAEIMQALESARDAQMAEAGEAKTETTSAAAGT